MKISGISASSYSVWDWCEFKLFLQGLGFEDVSGPSAVIGHIAHKVLEVLSKLSMVKHDPSSKFWNINYLWEICFNRYYTVETSAALRIETPKLVNVCKGINELLRNEYTPIRDNTIDAEVKFNIPMHGKEFTVLKTGKQLIVRGFIDRVDKINEDTIEIVDYKTGTRSDYDSKDRHKKGPDDLFNSIQPKLYHFAAKELYPWAKHVLVTFIYLVDGGAVTVPFEDRDLIETRELIKQRFKAIQSTEDPQRNLSWKCKVMCPFGKDGTCEHVWKEKEELGVSFVESKYHVLNERKKFRR